MGIHWYDNVLKWTPLSPITIINCCSLKDISGRLVLIAMNFNRATRFATRVLDIHKYALYALLRVPLSAFQLTITIKLQ